MRFAIRTPMFVCLAALLTMAGCQKVEVSKADSLNPGDALAPIIVDAPNRDQAVTVVVTPSGGAVDVYICSEEDANPALKDRKAPKASYSKQMKVDKETTITATAPAKKSYAVVVTGATKPNTNVNLKLTAK